MTRYNHITGKHEVICPLCNFRFPVKLDLGVQLVRCEDDFEGCGKNFAIKLEEKVERYTTIYKFEEVK